MIKGPTETFWLTINGPQTCPCETLLYTHRDILIEATSSQKVCATSVSFGDQVSISSTFYAQLLHP